MTLRLALPLLLAGVAAPALVSNAAPQAAPAAADTRAEDARLNAFLDTAFDANVALSPESQTALGLKTNYDKLDDYSRASGEKRMAMAEATLKQMRAQFDPAKLGPQARLSYRLFETQVERSRASYMFRDYGFPVSTNGSPAGQIPVFLINNHRIATVADARAYIARIAEVERVMGEVATTMRDQAKKGIVPPKMVFKPAREDARKVITGAPFGPGEDSTLLADFRKKVTALEIPDAEKAALIADAEKALTGPFKRGFDTLFAVLDEIEPKSKGNDGAWSLPNGAAFYANRLAQNTTTDMTADQIHQIGLDQVAAIRAEMEAVKARIGYTGSLESFFEVVRTDPKLKFPNTDAGREAYLTEARAVVAKMMEAAPRWFHRLPKAKLEVRAVEKWREGTASVAFYNRPAPDGSRPGIYYTNLANMDQVQKIQLEGIAVHEGAPGHHFQIARAMELEGLPKFRRFGGYSVYSEGWGLYTERLAKEMGGYADPYSEFGMLSLQMWRAIRLVTDTGLHAKKWSREQAIDYFKANSSISPADIEREVNRYINNPGQATSYMIGQLKIAELRKKAEAALGAKFDIRDFHEVVLANGAVPLNVLSEEVDRYIAAKKG
ncbi:MULTISPECIES: DUF885 family protein [unclassified Sphingomonas]|uniref:DUF885 domain-containing protein n=1 Tax=unclassified Sphingomonas TaxID=196159 RepID=UPI002150950C|nr:MULTISPECIES: DUF885 domain-containing protein [unclassified Sphingomonas]MCR5870478.1 DUF885 domain-containing protein [Sphingomonas sp. J344]UUY01176.1 DUF885 domain-containing protein [Sphingomonas sp. J315]